MLFVIRKALIIALFAFSFTTPLTAAAEGAIAKASERGVLRVGLSSFVPWAMRNKDGSFHGFEVDVATELAKDMGVRVQIIPTPWEGLIPALISKKIDVIIAGMTITPKRNLQVNFTEPYAFTDLVFIANKQKIANIEHSNDLAGYNDKSITFVQRRGTIPAIYVREKLPNATLRLFDDDATIMRELLNGKAHVWITPNPSPEFVIAEHPDKLVIPFRSDIQPSRDGMALRKGDIDSLNFLNQWIALKHARGWLEERRNYWFRTRDWQEK